LAGEAEATRWPVRDGGQATRQTVAVVSEPFSSVEPKPEEWLNKDFFKVEKLKSISVTTTNATNNWKLSRGQRD